MGSFAIPACTWIRNPGIETPMLTGCHRLLVVCSLQPGDVYSQTKLTSANPFLTSGVKERGPD